MLGRSWADSLEPRGVSVLLMHREYVFDLSSFIALTRDPTAGASRGDGHDARQRRHHLGRGVREGRFEDVIEGSKLGDGSKGMLSYDGQVLTW